MKKAKLYCLISSFLSIFAGTVFSQNPDQAEEWNNLSITQVNEEGARTIAIPFQTEAQAQNSVQIEKSPYYQSLNGVWKFNWVSDPDKRPKYFYKTDYNVAAWDDIHVPANWQMEGIRKHKFATFSSGRIWMTNT
ncbi:hypothetical protein [Viscerimonas tarda]